jgi:uncharacterized phage protein gp47/JayE
LSSYPLPTLAAQVSATGISAPAFEDILASEIATYQGIYGSDVLLTPDTQDGQLISVRCTAINDTNQLAIAVYNSYSPTYAQGVGLSAAVQINGLNREISSNSTVTVVIIGVAGTFIPFGVVQDTSGNLWNLPISQTIPTSGQLTVTATAESTGALSAAPNTVTTIYNIVAGWQSVNNPAAATPGNPVETDAALRTRQAQSTALQAQTPLGSILAAVANTGGIGRYAIEENQTSVTDVNGVPGHSIAVIVEGGNVTTIAQTIEQKKAPGTGTYGTTTITVTDPSGVPIPISFYEMTEVPIYAAVTIQPLTGYVQNTATTIVNTLVAFIASLGIGEEVYYNWLTSIAGLTTLPVGQTFVITTMAIGTSSTALSNANIPMAFNDGASCVAANIVLTVL